MSRVIKVAMFNQLPRQIEFPFTLLHTMVREGRLPTCCYQLSEALVRVLRQRGYPEARTVLADVFLWNDDYRRVQSDSTLRDEWLNGLRKKESHDKSKTYNKRTSFKKRARLSKKKKVKPYLASVSHNQNGPDGGYDGHVMVEVDGNIICPTFTQFSRKQHGIKAPPYSIIPVEEFTLDDKSEELIEKLCHAFMDASYNGDEEVAKDVAMAAMSQGYVAIKGHPERGWFAICLRPDVEPNYMNTTDTAEDNVAWLVKDLLQLIDGGD